MLETYTYSAENVDGDAGIPGTDSNDDEINDYELVENIIVGDDVESIGASAFSDCVKLKSIIIPNSVDYIGNNAFLGCSALRLIIVNENNSKYSSQNGILYNKEKTEFIIQRKRLLHRNHLCRNWW